MSGVVKVVGAVALVATGIGAAIGAGIIGGAGVLGGALAASSGGLIAGGTVLGLGAATWSTIGLVAGLTSAIGSSVLSRSPPSVKASPANLDRLNASIIPLTGRKSVVGRTAMATDIRDQEYTDSQTYLHRFIVCAAHKVQGFEEIWFDDKLAWTSGGGVQGEFAGYLTVTAITEGSAGNAINISARMGTTRRFTGCAYAHLRFKLTGNSSSADSPFAQAIPSRLTIVGKGALFYDPRLDSTVTGGSGSHRASNQATWAWNDSACRNPALALLFYLLGWRINGELSVGLGIPPGRIDLESFITAANLCDEDVSLAAGGTEKRYRCDAIWSETDDPTVVLDQLKAAMNADLDDVGGKLRLTVFHNDLASPVADFGPDNIIGQVQWDQTAPLHETSNIVRGTFTDASSNSLYQQVDFPQVALTSIDGIDRIDQLNLAAVQSASQAQRLAKQRLQRQQYGGILRTVLDVTGWRVLKNDPIRLTLPVFGWSNKLFRIAEIEQGMDGAVPVVLREEHADIYAWDADESPAVVPAAPTQYDRTLDPIISTIAVDLPAVIANSARSGTAFPDAADSQAGQLFIRTDLNNRLYIRTAGDATLEVADGAVLVAASGGGTETIYLPPWVEVSDLRIIEALATGENAYELANEAIDALADLADDGILSRKEKTETLIPRAAELERRYSELVTAATSLSVSSSAAASARTAWLAMLAAITPAWNDASADSPVDRGDYDAARDDYDDELEALDRAIKEKAATLATWSLVSGSGKPEDNATRNVGRDAYDAGETYSPGDAVNWLVADGGDGGGYIRIGAGNTTGTPPSDGTKWARLVSAGADGVSPLIIAPSVSSIPLRAYASGDVKTTELPRTISHTAKRDGVTKTITGISLVTESNCDASVSGSSVSIDDASATGFVEYDVTADGETQRFKIPITVTADGAQGSGEYALAITGGFSGGTYAQHGGEASINASSTGKIDVNLAGSYTCPAGLGESFQAQWKLQYSVGTSGSWSDVSGSETVGELSQSEAEPPNSAVPGSVSSSGPFSLTGLTPNGAYVFRLLIRKNAGLSSAAAASDMAIFVKQVT